MITHELPVSGIPTLDLHAPAASVVLDRGPSGVVRVEIDSRNAESWHVAQNGDAISVRDERRGWRSGNGGRLRVAAPDDTAVRITTASGDVIVSVATGRTQVTTASGDVRIAIASELTVKTASGSITVDRVGSDAAVKSASGDLRAQEIGGGLNASTASGDVRIERVGGDVNVSTASGDVRVDRFEGRSFNANTVSGDVQLGIPAGSDVALEVKTLTGSIEVPSGDRAPDVPSRGRVDVRVKSVSGDFRLRRA